MPFDVTLTSKNNKKVKKNWDTYKYISSYPKHPEFSNGVTELPLHGRAVRFKVKCGEKESFITLFTNLSADSFSTDDLKEIYRLRWQIEISFRDLKRELGLEHIHGRKKELVIGEVYAKRTIYNMNSRIRNHVEKRKKIRLQLERAVKRKAERKIDFTFLTAATRSFFWNEGAYTGAGLVKLLERKTESVRPGRPRR
ncbi:transposase [Allobaculum fili]|uniref:transposase n=1 Tax=Allobaculum fili TaxID=2834460 RepID=UPI0034E1948C